MIILEDKKELIINFITDSIEAFKVQKGTYNSIGIYCCPWAGWITASFNINKSLTITQYNCPDFEFVEFEVLELDTWEHEYANNTPVYVFKGKTLNFHHDLGDEVLNELFFIFLSDIIQEIKYIYKEDFLLQMLDSTLYKVF